MQCNDSLCEICTKCLCCQHYCTDNNDYSDVIEMDAKDTQDFIEMMETTNFPYNEIEFADN